MGNAHHRWPWDILTGATVYALSSLPVYLGLAVGTTPGLFAHYFDNPGFLGACCYFDGGHYHVIVRDGYSFDPEKESNVAFFPGYPLVAQCLRQATGIGPPLALFITSNTALAVALVLISAYLRTRFPDEPPHTRLTTLTLIALWPLGYFFRVAYSESLCLAVLALLLLGLARRWPVVLLILIAGALTGIRSVGIAGTVAVAASILFDASRGSVRRRMLTAAALFPLGCWGLLAYMAYQYAVFDNPLAFAQTQRHWAFYTPPEDAGPLHKWARLAIAEPIWNVYVPGSQRHWSRIDGSPAYGVAFWNPILFLLAVASIGYGWFRKWLTRPEVVLGFGLLLIPYCMRAYEMNMIQHARFAAIVIPAFVVMGRVLSRLPPFVSWIVFAGSSPLLVVWAALFAASYPLG